MDTSEKGDATEPKRGEEHNMIETPKKRGKKSERESKEGALKKLIKPLKHRFPVTYRKMRKEIPTLASERS